VICHHVLVQVLWFNRTEAFRRDRNSVSSQTPRGLRDISSGYSTFYSDLPQEHQSTSSFELGSSSTYLVEGLHTSYLHITNSSQLSRASDSMLSPKLSTLALGMLLFGASSMAAPHAGKPRVDRRDDPISSGVDGPTTNLEPVIPPEVDQDALSILALDTHVDLAWAGTPADAGTKRMLKRAGSVLAQAALTFAYPTVPLDHSSFVSGVSCSGDTLTGTLTSTAYAYAKKQWSGAPDILFVTSVDGCGAKDANDLFHATKIAFSDSGKTFSATGSSAVYKDVATRFTLTWGNVGSSNLRRAIDKRDVRRALLSFHNTILQ
jgi:hypothetical protein